MRLIPFADVIGTQGLPTITAGSFTFPKTHSYSVCTRGASSGTRWWKPPTSAPRGRDLVGLVNINVVPYGALSTGVLGNADLSVPVNRVALDPSLVNTLRPYPAYGPITPFDYGARSQYHSLQVTLSRQTGKRLQYFVAYTLSRAEGTLAPELFPAIPTIRPAPTGSWNPIARTS